MGIKSRKPTTSSQRFTKLVDGDELQPKGKKPEKSLTRPLKKSGGRNAHGHVTTRHRGGGHKRKYRIIDFRRFGIFDLVSCPGISFDKTTASGYECHFR